jgi:hypothetical protein
MKKCLVFACLVLAFCLVLGCAHQVEYKPPVITPTPPIPRYTLPPDPFATVDPPKPIFLAQQSDGTFKEVPKGESTVIGYTAREHDKIVLRLQYYKELVPQLERMVNVYIEINNVRIQLQMDEQLAKEVYRKLWIDTTNQANSDKMWAGVQDAGQWAIIIGQLAVILGLAL